jgi:hypothetical protein
MERLPAKTMFVKQNKTGRKSEDSSYLNDIDAAVEVLDRSVHK